MRCLIDTNVAKTANVRANASDACILECVRALRQIIKNGHLFLDDRGLIFDEYRKNLSLSGQPGAGDMFLKWVHDHQYVPSRCTLVAITPKGREEPPVDFKEFPDHPELRDFHGKDRKFVAVAAAHPEHPPILNATDTDWWIARRALEECGIRVVFICPEIEEVHRRKTQRER